MPLLRRNIVMALRVAAGYLPGQGRGPMTMRGSGRQ
jgi:hypothetical protein